MGLLVQDVSQWQSHDVAGEDLLNLIPEVLVGDELFAIEGGTQARHASWPPFKIVLLLRLELSSTNLAKLVLIDS